MKFSKKEADLGILDELIGKCEDAMIRPFRKKKAVAIAVEPEADDEQEFEDEKPDLEDMDLEELLEMYQKLQDDK